MTIVETVIVVVAAAAAAAAAKQEDQASDRWRNAVPMTYRCRCKYDEECRIVMWIVREIFLLLLILMSTTMTKMIEMHGRRRPKNATAILWPPEEGVVAHVDVV